MGDAIITAFGAHVRALGPGDMVAGRIGGEEFALLLPGTGIETARRLAEVIRIGFPTSCAETIPPSLVPTTSIGLAAGMAGEGLSQLMRRADQALYDAKRAGRNRVRAFRPEPVLPPAAAAG
jgi:diguanylate cyclase (GGDEF)-like protein